MIIKLISTLLLFFIGLIEKFYKNKIKKYNILKNSLFILFLLSFFIANIAIIYDDIKNKRNLNNAKVDRDNLFQKNIELSDKLSKFRNEFQNFNSDSQKQSIILQNKVTELNTKLEPFVKLAISKYPTSSINDALIKLTNELEETKKLAAPSYLSFYEKNIIKINEGFSVVLKFKPSKNEHLGNIAIKVVVLGNNQTKIIDFWPTLAGGAFQTGSDSKRISKNGKEALLIYQLIGIGNPDVELKLSGSAQINIRGNHQLKSFNLVIE